jgi:hypothetical protein
MIYTHTHSELQEAFIKRRVFANMDQPKLNSQQKAQEVKNLREKIAGKEIEKKSGVTKVEGKAKKIVDSISELQTKVASLGINVEKEFENYIKKKITESPDLDANDKSTNLKTLDINSGEKTQVTVTSWVETVTKNANERLREFDRGLDKVMLRVNFRKQMAERLDALGKPPEVLSTDQKNKIGTALEGQLAKLEGDIEGNTAMSTDQLKSRMNVMHEVSKYANMLNVCNKKSATTLQTKTKIPAVSIAYPPTSQNGFTFFEYWVEPVGGDQVLHCIDNYGKVQQFNPFQTEAFGKNPWEMVYKPGKLRSNKLNSSYTDALIDEKKANVNSLSTAEREMMLTNGMQERVFINAVDRGFTGMPAKERSVLEGLLAAEFNRLKASQKASYLANPGSSSSFQPMVKTFEYANSSQFQTSVKNKSNKFGSIVRGKTFDTMTGTTPAITGKTTTSPGSSPSSRPSRTASTKPGSSFHLSKGPKERVVSVAEQVTYPSTGILPWANEQFTSPKMRTLAVLKEKRTLKDRIIKHVFINDVPVSNDRVSVDLNDNKILKIKGRAAGENEVTVIYEDTDKSGTKESKRLNIKLNGAAPALSDTTYNNPEFAQFDPSSVRKGPIDTTNGPIEVARLNPSHPEITQELLSCKDGLNDIKAELSTDGVFKVLIKNFALGEKVTPPKTLRLALKVTDKRNGRNVVKTVIRRLEIVDRDPAPASHVKAELTAPIHHIGAISNQKLSSAIHVATLQEDTDPNFERQVVDENGKEIKYLKIDRKKVVVRNDKNITLPINSEEFRIISRPVGSTGDWTKSELYKFENKDPELALKTLSGKTFEVKRGELPAFVKTPLFSIKDDLPVGSEIVSLSGEAGFTSSPQGEIEYKGAKAFSKKGCILKAKVKTVSGKMITVNLAVVISEAEELADNALQLKDSTKVKDISHKSTRTGKIDTRTSDVKIKGIKIEANPGIGVEIKEVRKGGQKGEELITSAGEAILSADAQGQVSVKAGYSLAPGTYFLKITSNNNGKKNPKNWVSIEIKDHLPASVEDVKPMVTTIESGIINTRTTASGLKQNFAKLYPARKEVTKRTLLSARTGPVVHAGIKFDESTNELSIYSSILPPGPLDLEFEVTVKGRKKEKVRIRIIVAERPASGATAAKRPNQMSLKGSNDKENRNLALHKKIMEVYNSSEAWTEIKGKLNNFENGKSSKVGSQNLAVIDARLGRYVVQNDDYSTEMKIDGNKIVLMAGENSKETTMRFNNDKNGIKKALMYASALNMIRKIAFDDMKLSSPKKYIYLAKNGEFFDMDNGLSTVDVRTVSGVTDPDIWNHTFLKPAERDSFLKVLNKQMEELVGYTNKKGDKIKSRKEAKITESQVGLQEARLPKVITEGDKLDLHLTNLSKDYTYSYTGDRTNWFQLSNVEGQNKVTLNWEDMDENITSTATKRYVRVLIVASPKDGSRNKRPVLIEKEIEVKKPYTLKRQTESQVIAVDNRETDGFKRNLNFDLTKGITETTDLTGNYSSDPNLTFREDLTSDGKAIILKGTEEFAELEFNQSTGIPKITFKGYLDKSLYKYEIRTDLTKGANATIKFMKSKAPKSKS